MELISAIVGALSAGAAALASGALSEAGKAAYNRLRGAILRIVSPANLEKLEQKPDSENRKSVLAEELVDAGMAEEKELAELAQQMITALKETGAVGATGYSLEEVKAINLRLRNITASGTGVSVKKSKFAGDIEAGDIDVGVAGYKAGRDIVVKVGGKVYFTVYHPKEIKPDVWCTLLAYMHLLKMQSTVEADAKRRLDVPHGRRFGESTYDIMRGLKSSLPPNCPVAGSIQHSLASRGSRTGTGSSFVCKLSRTLPVSSWGRPSTDV